MDGCRATNKGAGFGVRGSEFRSRSSGDAKFPPAAGHSAFTLVELLTVITIIGILASLASVAAYKVFFQARGAAIKADITNMDNFLAQFKNEHGDYPPSNLDHTNSAAQAAMIRFITKAFPRCNAIEEVRHIPRADGTLPTYNNGAYSSSSPAMSPAQALAFWLRGFSANKQRPLSSLYDPQPAERVGGLEFNGRLINPNTKTGWVIADLIPPVFQAPSGSQPYVYFESRSYLYHNNQSSATVGSGNFIPYMPYMWDSNNDGAFTNLDWDANNNGKLDSSEQAKIYANPKSYQIVSAGVDGDFGTPTSPVAKSFPLVSGTLNLAVAKIYRSGEGYASEDDDNITNFSQQSLGDAKPQ
ncbi:MAG: prepilin-type N-terminal cleavage/methylation domain-containing protein [Pirellulales bacterium]|nr:prepilin-type N-terminal cleavage/methylation domain-containing protein [Pirellulales bacterium]